MGCGGVKIVEALSFHPFTLFALLLCECVLVRMRVCPYMRALLFSYITFYIQIFFIFYRSLYSLCLCLCVFVFVYRPVRRSSFILRLIK